MDTSSGSTSLTQWGKITGQLTLKCVFCPSKVLKWNTVGFREAEALVARWHTVTQQKSHVNCHLLRGKGRPASPILKASFWVGEGFVWEQGQLLFFLCFFCWAGRSSSREGDLGKTKSATGSTAGRWSCYCRGIKGREFWNLLAFLHFALKSWALSEKSNSQKPSRNTRKW